MHNAWWKEIKTLLESFDFYENPDATLTDVNIPYLGKFILNKKKIKHINGRIKIKRDTAAIKSDTDNSK